MLMLQVREAKAHAPKETRNGNFKYPDGKVVKKPQLKDRTEEDPATMEKDIAKKYNNKLSKDEKMSLHEERKAKKAYRNKLVAFAHAKVDYEMAAYDLYVDPAKEVMKDKFYEKRVTLGVTRRDEDE